MQRKLQDDLAKYNLKQLDIPDKKRLSPSFKKSAALPSEEVLSEPVSPTKGLLLALCFFLLLTTGVFLFIQAYSTSKETSLLAVITYPSEEDTYYYSPEAILLPATPFEESGLTILPERLVPLGTGGYQLYLSLQNSTNHHIAVILHYLTINDYFIEDAVLYHDISDGDWVRTQIWLEEDALPFDTMAEIYQISFALHVIETGSQEPYTLFFTQPISLTLGSAPPVQSREVSGLFLTEYEGLHLFLQDTSYHQAYQSLELTFYIENQTEHFVHFSDNGVELAEEQFFAGLYALIPPNTVGYSRVSIPITDSLGYVDQLLLHPVLTFEGESHYPAPLYIPVHQQIY